MPFQIETEITCYLLPGDGEVAETEFLNNLNARKATWVIAYSFTLVPMIDELLSASASGVPLHLYLDHSQAVGHYEAAQIHRLVEAGVEVTVGTSPVGSQYICHTKGLAIDVTPPWCWEGSVNFSKSGWNQVNTAMVFHSQEWRDQFVQQFVALRQFAWSNERTMQIMSSPPPGVTAGAAVPVGSGVGALHPASATAVTSHPPTNPPPSKPKSPPHRRRASSKGRSKR
jgi:hypothetical protein